MVDVKVLLMIQFSSSNQLSKTCVNMYTLIVHSINKTIVDKIGSYL